MGKKTKIKILSYLILIIMFIAIRIMLHFVFKNLDSFYIGMISAGLTGVLAPRINDFKTQSGDKIQIKWVFLKKPFIV